MKDIPVETVNLYPSTYRFNTARVLHRIREALLERGAVDVFSYPVRPKRYLLEDRNSGEKTTTRVYSYMRMHFRGMELYLQIDDNMFFPDYECCHPVGEKKTHYLEEVDKTRWQKNELFRSGMTRAQVCEAAKALAAAAFNISI